MVDFILKAASVVLATILLSLLGNDVGDWIQRLAERLTRRAARKLDDPGLTTRYEEEWGAYLQDVPGKLAKLVVAAGFLFAASKMRRRDYALDVGMVSLLAMLLAAVGWSVAYALEVSSATPGSRQLWGDLKYVGICLLTPAWLVFVFQYLGRTRWLNRRMAALLAIEPLTVLILLANDATHDLVRYYAPGGGAVAEAGPVYWPHLLYTNAILWVGTVLFVISSAQRSRVYRRQAAVLVVSVLLPVMANLLFNLRVPPFREVDLTPFAFTLTVAVLIFAVYQWDLLDQLPMARGQIFETFPYPVLVLDHSGRVIDANPAAAQLVGRPAAEAVGRAAVELLPALGDHAVGQATANEITVAGRTYDLDVSSLPGQRGGQLVVARDVTERRQVEQRILSPLEHEQVAPDRLAAALERKRRPPNR